MQAQTVEQMVRIQGWAAQVNDRNQSGLTVRQWCRENGVETKTYYYRQKRVREELLEAIELNGAVGAARAAQLAEPERRCVVYEQGAASSPEKGLSTTRTKPVFAALPMPQNKSAVVTVRMSGYMVDIYNNAEDMLVEHVLRVVSKL